MHRDPPSRAEYELEPPRPEVERLIVLLRRLHRLLAADEELGAPRGGLDDLAVTARSALSVASDVAWEHILLLERLQSFRLSAGHGAADLDRRKLQHFVGAWLSDALWQRWATPYSALDAVRHKM